MDDKFYAVVDKSGRIGSLDFGDAIKPVPIFNSEKSAYECLIRISNPEHRVIEVRVFSLKERKND